MTLDEAISPAVEAELDSYEQHILEGNSATPFEFSTLDLTLVNFQGLAKILEYGSFRGQYENPVIGTNASQSLTGTEEADLIVGLSGNDTLNGMGGDDILIGSSGTNQLFGGEGNDTFLNSGSGSYGHIDEETGLDKIVAVTDNTTIGLIAYVNDVEEISGSSLTDVVVSGTSAHQVLDFSNTLLMDISEIDALGGHDIVTASNLSSTAYRGGAGNDTLIAGDVDVTWLYSGTNNDYDTLTKGNANAFVVAESDGTRIGLNGNYENAVISFDGAGFADVRILGANAHQVLDFSETVLTDIAEIDALGGNDRIVASILSHGNYRGGTGQDTFVVLDTEDDDQGNITFLDFDPLNDIIDLTDFLLDSADAFASLSITEDTGTGDALVELRDGTVLRLVGFDPDSLTEEDFLF